MARTTIDRLVINSPYEEPKYHWRYDRVTRQFELIEGRRPAGYVIATPGLSLSMTPVFLSNSHWSIRFAHASNLGARLVIRV